MLGAMITNNVTEGKKRIFMQRYAQQLGFNLAPSGKCTDLPLLLPAAYLNY